MRTDFVLDAQEQALYDRQPQLSDQLVHHSDRGAQYVSIRHTECLAEAGIEPSVGSRGDNYDKALAETINGLYKAELIHRRYPWKFRESVELATLQWVHWFNHTRLLEPIGYIPPVEAEANYWRQLSQTGETASSSQTNQPPENLGGSVVRGDGQGARGGVGDSPWVHTRQILCLKPRSLPSSST
jgi:putative transposase